MFVNPNKIFVFIMLAAMLACSGKNNGGFSGLEETKALDGSTAAATDASSQPILSKIGNQSTYAGQAVNFTLVNERTGSNAGMTYTCFYTVTGAGLIDATPQAWSSLPGATPSTFDPTAGVFSWTPPATAVGSYSLYFTGTNAAGSDQTTVSVTVATDKRPHLVKILDVQALSGSTVNVQAANNNTVASSPLTYSCYYDQKVDGVVGTQTSCSKLPGQPVIKFDTGGGQLVWQPSTSDVGTYEIRIDATDPDGTDSAVFVVTVALADADVVRLTTFPTFSPAAGDTVTFDVNNEVTHDDTGVAYSCYFDTMIDGVVANTTPCDALPGTPAAKFDPTTAKLTWTTQTGTTGQYELKVTGTKGNYTATSYIGVSFASNPPFGVIGNSAVSFTPASWDFGSVRVGSTSATKTITVQNSASLPIFLAPLAVASPQFALDLSSCPTAPASLGAGQSCSVVLHFSPQVASQLGSLFNVQFGKDAADSTTFAATLGLSGVGIGAVNFSGLSAITAITHNSLTLNWPQTPNAVSFLVFQVGTGGALTYIETLLNTGGTVQQRNYSGLAPSTVYTYRVRATDALGTVDTNTNDVTATTLGDVPPVINAQASFSLPAGNIMTAIQFHDSFTGNSTDRGGDPITFGCVFDTTVDGAVADSASPCTSLQNQDGSSPSFSSATGSFTGFQPRYTDTGTQFEIKVTATDPYAAKSSVVFVVTVTAGAPLLNTPSGDLFPASALQVGDSLNFDLNNTRLSPAGDTGMTYTCQFKVAGHTGLGAATACTSLPGASAAFNTATGVFAWTTTASSVGGYQIIVSGANLAGTDTESFNVAVRNDYPRAGIVFELDSLFATGLGPARTDAGYTGTWTELTSSTPLTMSGFSGASAWVGSGTATAPYALTFNGTTTHVDTGITFNSETEMSFDGWVNPSNPLDDHQTIWSFGDAAGHGWTLTNGALVQGDGSDPYRAAVLADNPAGFWSYDLLNGTAVADLSPNGLNGTLTATPTIALNIDPPFHTATNRGIETTTGGVLHIQNVVLGAGWSAESWFRTPFPTGCGWCTLFRSATTDHQLIIDSSMNLGAYQSSSGTFHSSGFNMNSLASGWHHAVVVGSGGTQTFYIDGASVGSIPWASTADIAAVGNEPGGSQPFGYIADSAIYNTALSPARVLAHYQAANTRAACNLGMAKNYWSHVAAHVTPSQLDVYVNGYHQCSIALGSYPAWAGSTVALRLGATNVSTLKSWQGQLSALRFFNQNVSDSAANLYSYLSTNYLPNLPIPQRDITLLVDADRGTFQDNAGTNPAAADGDPVAQWVDYSGLGDNMLVSAANHRPLLKLGIANGHNALRFDGVDDSIYGQKWYGTNYSIFYVTQALSSPGRSLGGLTNNYLMGTWMNSINQLYANNWIAGPGGTAAILNDWMVFSTVESINSVAIFRNGSIVGSTTGTNNEGPRGIDLGSWEDGSESSNCDITEVFGYLRGLSGTERAAVEQYLITRYNVH